VVTAVSRRPAGPGGRVLSVIGLIASGAGAFLLVSGFMLRFFVAGHTVKFPLNEYQVATLTAPDVTYFNSAEAKELSGVTMRVTRTTEGDVAAGDGSRAVWTQFSSFFDTTNGLPFNAVTQRSAFDRRTGAAVACCDAVSGSFTGAQSGQVFTWPIGAGKQALDIFDPTVNRPEPASFAGTSTVGGVPAYRYVERVTGVKFGTQRLPGALVGVKGQQTVTLDETYTATNTYWVDPVTGAVLNVNQNQDITLRDQGAVRLVLFRGSFRATPQTVASIAHTDKPRRAAITAITVTVPIALGLSGAVILAVGILLVIGRRKRPPARTVPRYETVAMAP
jgi:Porin PorA